MAKLFPSAYQFLDSNGDPVASGTVNFYQNGTTTDKNIYTDVDLQTAATNPAQLTASGRFSQGDLFGSGEYTVVLKDSSGAQIWSRDDHTGGADIENKTVYELGTTAAANSHIGVITGHLIETSYHDSNRVAGSGGQFRYTGTTTAGKAGNWPDSDGKFYDTDGKQFEMLGARNLLAFGAKGDDSTDDTAAITSALASANAAAVGDGRRVIVPDGTYRYSTISLNSYSEISIIGLTTQIWDSTAKGAVFKGNTDSVDGFVYNPASLTRCGIHLENLFFDGNSQTDTNVKFDNFRGVSVLRCVSINCVVDGFDFGGDSINNTSLYVEQCYVNNPGASGFIVDCALAEFRENKCDNGTYALDIGPNQGSGTYISNNFEGATTANIRCRSSLNSFTDNRLAAPTTANVGILFTGTFGRNNNVKGGSISSDGSANTIGIHCETGRNQFSDIYISDVTDGVLTEAGENSFSNINFNSITTNAFRETSFGGVGNTIVGGLLQSGTMSLSNATTKVKGLIGYSDKYGIAAATLASGNTNDYSIDEEVETIFITADAANSTITGIAGGQQGKRLVIINRTTNNLIIAHDDANSSATNRIRLPNSANITLDDYESITLNYDSNTGRWLASSFTQ